MKYSSSLGILLIIVVVVSITVRPAIAYLSKNKARTGLQDEKFAECPNKPNCVSSMTSDESQKVEPLSLKANTVLSLDSIADVIKQQPGTQIISLQPHYLHATYQSQWLGFIDDVELLIQPGSDVIDVKSASRLGHSDLGANRKRIEALRATLQL